MIKLFLSPLFVGLFLLSLFCGVLWQQRRNLQRLSRIALVANLGVIVGLLVLSLPSTAMLLVRSREVSYYEAANHLPEKIPVVVVLGGGYITGESPEEDRLVYDSIIRVIKGVQVFKSHGARLLVLSGRSLTREPKDRHGALMRDLALQFGVPAARIRLEDQSRNTLEHPVQLRKFADIVPDEPVAVVTSGWHLRRAMKEFQRYFPKAVPVPAYFLSGGGVDARAWIPDASALSLSTMMLHEHIGDMWYALQHTLQIHQ